MSNIEKESRLFCKHCKSYFDSEKKLKSHIKKEFMKFEKNELNSEICPIDNVIPNLTKFFKKIMTK